MQHLPDNWRDHVGSASQVARLDKFAEADGTGVGRRRMRIETGGGLALDLLPDRALDLGHATFDGMPLAWISQAGFSPASSHGGRAHDWLRGFGGGLLATCGLDSFGPPSVDGGRSHGQHGPVGALPAEILQAGIDEITGRIVVVGRVRQTALFSESLVLDRRIETEIGSTAVTIKDRVTNEGVTAEGHMILYHFNLGWPLLGSEVRLTGPGLKPVPRDADAQAGLEHWDKFSDPVADYPEQVFIHDAPSGLAKARLENDKRGVALALEWDATVLPAMFQWKLMLRRHYALGLEPANTSAIHGRASARAAGLLPILEPGEVRSYRIRVNLERLP